MKSQLNNFPFRRKSGILMPVSSLPSPYGIGSFGKSAYEFVDFLAESGTKCWQVLPLNPTSYGDSPYQSPASVAGNPYFIDLDLLRKEGLLGKERLAKLHHDTERVDYGYLFATRYAVLREAYAHFAARREQRSAAYRAFVKRSAAWLEDYALFMSLKEHYHYAAWWTWEEEHRDVARARTHASEMTEEMDFWRFVQYKFDAQWRDLVAYAHERGVRIVGDMPIYVAHDSMDVWQSPDQFLLDENYNPILVAGCPPDGFSPDGQLWGNPIYDWAKMEKDGFAWWCNRVEAAFRLYDILRIDHFRGFAGYYAIPFGHETAREGHWESAPGVALFDTVRARFPKARIIAEDLGFITDDVRALLAHTGFPGMKILQFAFYDENSEYLPRTYTTDNCVVYTGSHDADCTRSWIEELSGEAKRRFRQECPHRKGQSRTMDLIELALSSRANLAVIPMQDYLELRNEDGRMNTPSVAEGNWTYRLKSGYRTKSLIRKIRTVAECTGRLS